MAAVFEPKDYLDVAKELYKVNVPASQKIALSEAYYRAAASRAYYAAYLFANKKASGNYAGIKESHDSLINEYIDSNNAEKKMVGNSLKSLKKLRKKADYSLNIELTKKDGGESLRLSEKILTVLASIPS